MSKYSKSPPHDSEARDASGKQRLIDAALRLHRERRSFSAMSIREIARDARLNPNTFYRHFESIDDLAVECVVQCGDRLRPMLRTIRGLASRVDALSLAALEVSAFYSFVLANADSFVTGVTEYHCGSTRVRTAIATMLHEVAREMSDDIIRLRVFPTIKPEHLAIATKRIVDQLFHFAQDYIEQPEHREAIASESEYIIAWLFLGASFGSPETIAAKFTSPHAASVVA
jgi:AcrR family transcriptional regulator